MRLRRKERSRTTGGVIWIGILAVLLAGVVALNVAVLRLNMRYDKLGRTKVDLTAQNADLQSQLSSGAAMQKIQQQARSELGLVAANPDSTKYIQLNP
jgi:cell division protein FtsB